MIYILKSNFEGQPNWMNDFSTNLEKGLHAAGAHVRAGYDIDIVDDLTRYDCVFITHYDDLDKVQVKQTKAKVIFHHHGSGVNPYTHWINTEAEIWSLYNVVDINTFCMPTQEKLVRKEYSFLRDKSVTIGFPLDFKKFEKYKTVPKKKKIVVAGHIGPERQFYLATYLLKDLMPEYEVVFSILETPGIWAAVTREWSKFYDLSRFIDMGFKFVQNPSSEGFYLELADASHIFTCSLGDTFSVSIVEGILCGCVPVIPDIQNFWPMIRDYVSFGYKPFDKESVELFPKWSSPPKVNLDWFKPNLVAKRLLDVLA